MGHESSERVCRHMGRGGNKPSHRKPDAAWGFANNSSHCAETPTAGARLPGQVPQPGAGVRMGWVLSLPCGTTATGWGPKRWGKSAELE